MTLLGIACCKKQLLYGIDHHSVQLPDLGAGKLAIVIVDATAAAAPRSLSGT